MNYSREVYNKAGLISYAIHRISQIRDTSDLCLTEDMKRDIIYKVVFEGFQAMDEIEFDAYLKLLILIGIYLHYSYCFLLFLIQ